MASPNPETERHVVLRTRVAEGYELTQLELKRLQRVFTDWFPGAVYTDLTRDTVRIDVVVRKGRLSGQSVYNASFVNREGSVVKNADYDEDRITGKVCANYDPRRSGYFGKKDGFDYRTVSYTLRPMPNPR
ncbi:MAG TPA: hypothetical protein VH881_06405 [Burkholderiales bacterium]|jgi:hypothetical protein